MTWPACFFLNNDRLSQTAILDLPTELLQGGFRKMVHERDQTKSFLEECLIERQ